MTKLEVGYGIVVIGASAGGPEALRACSSCDAPGSVEPGASNFLSKDQAGITATISKLRGLTMTISSPTSTNS